MPLTGEYAPKLDSNIMLKSSVSQQSSEVVSLKLLSPDQICHELAEKWQAIRSSNTDLSSPYFDLKFTQAVSRVRDDVEIAVFYNSGNVVAFLPFHRTTSRHGVPVGGRLNDSHGILIRHQDQHRFSDHRLIEQMMAAAGLDVFAYHSMSRVDSSLKPFEFRQLGSHYLDLSAGWEQYYHWARNNSVAIKRQSQKTRKMERELGPIRFEFDCRSSDVLENLIRLKRNKYQRTNTFDILSVDWASDLLREISNIDHPDFKGLLSVLFAGNSLVAVHFGMMTNQILHYWFPVYNPNFHQYSPGSELLLKVAHEASLRGIKKLDLGYGDDEYKFRFCNGHELVSFGQVNVSPLGFRVAKQRYVVRQKLKGIPMKPLVKSMLRGLFPGFGQWHFK